MAGGEGALGLRASRAPENENMGDVDERQSRHARDDVLHQQREPFGVVDHRLPPHCTSVGAAQTSHIAHRHWGEKAPQWTGRDRIVRKTVPRIFLTIANADRDCKLDKYEMHITARPSRRAATPRPCDAGLTSDAG